MKKEESYSSVQKMLGDLAGGFYIMEQQIDVEVQMAYFKMVKSIRKDINPEECLGDYDMLFSDEVLLEDKKEILVRIAGVKTVEAYRLLEEYLPKANEQLKDWSALAYNECKMQLESSLNEQSSVFVSTGMGGKGNALRYFIVLFAHEEIDETFSDFHIEFVKKELDFVLQQFSSELEVINETNESFISATALIPINVNLQDCLHKLFDACNQLAPFVSDRFIVTNIKTMSAEEILNFKDEDDEVDETSPIDLE